MLVVVAVGGNALIRRGEGLSVEVQRHNVQSAARSITELAARHRIVLTHGNGPQVGLLAMQNEAFSGTAPYPMDVLVAESQGMVGYLLAQELGRRIGTGRVATLLTQVVVDAHDPAFSHPTKPVGPIFEPAVGERLRDTRGWTIAADGNGVRRTVPSPEPRRTVEIDAVRALLEAGALVICSGGGGIPVVEAADGRLSGIEAVIDKDLSAALLACELGADALVLLTDVDAAYSGFGTPDAVPIRSASVAELRGLDLAAGSMGPKVEAACRFAQSGGVAAIGSLDDARSVLEGSAGTVVHADRQT